MIYLNNAATTYPKPPSVVRAVTEALQHPPVSALRSTATEADDLTARLRRRLGTLFHIADWERIFFCSGATSAVNRILAGLNVGAIHTGDDAHNSVLRPAMNARPRHDFGPGEPTVDVTVKTHCDNVTGVISNVGRQEGLGSLLMVDAAQSAGCVPLDVDALGIDILVFTGHKGLFGPMGTGGYYVRRGISLRPMTFGGTGRDSSVVTYSDGDWEYETGTQNMPGLAGLLAGVDFVLSQGVENIFFHERMQANWLIEKLSALPRVTVYSPGGFAQGPVVSFNIEGLLPADVGYILQNSYGITVRTGLHCAPLAHRRLGTEPHGTVRASLSHFTTDEHLEALVKAVEKIAASL